MPCLFTVGHMSGNVWHCLETFKTVWKLSRLSETFPACLESFQTVRRLSRPFGNFPNCLESLQTVRPETFKTVWKLSWPFRTSPGCPETSQTVWKLSTLLYSSVQLISRLHFMGNFVNTRKNFPDAQKLSGRQCRRADEVFGTLAYYEAGWR